MEWQWSRGIEGWVGSARVGGAAVCTGRWDLQKY